MRTLFCALAACTAVSFAAVAADVIAERKAGFKANGASMKAMTAAIRAGDAATVAEKARVVADWSARMVDYFPEGSGSGDTDARPEIWLEFDKFTALARDAETAALELAALADAGSGDLAAGLGKLGGTCKACHQSFKDG